MEMPLEWIPILAKHCASKGVDFICTPFDEGWVEALDPYVPAFKVASYELSHVPLLRKVLGCGKPTFISTGASKLDEVEQVVELARETGNEQIVLLQCTAAYPTPLQDVNARALGVLGAGDQEGRAPVRGEHARAAKRNQRAGLTAKRVSAAARAPRDVRYPGRHRNHRGDGGAWTSCAVRRGWMTPSSSGVGRTTLRRDATRSASRRSPSRNTLRGSSDDSAPTRRGSGSSATATIRWGR